MRMRLSRTTCIAGSASGFVLTNHCVLTSGSTIVSQRSQRPTGTSCGSVFTSVPSPSKILTSSARASKRSRPARSFASSFIVPSRFIAVISGRLCRWPRSEEHTSELQSRQYIVCRLLLEKKKKIIHSELEHMLPCYTQLYHIKIISELHHPSTPENVSRHVHNPSV